MSVVPDKITPEIGWRGWSVDDGLILSPTFTATWIPNEPFVAACTPRTPRRSWVTMLNSGFYEWRLVSDPPPDHGVRVADFDSTAYTDAGLRVPPAPKIELPRGLTYALYYEHRRPKRDDHGSCPGDNCHCGIYAANSPIDANGYAGYDDRVLGRVHLWGKVIPGDKGWRAEIAYPAEFFVIPKPGKLFRKREQHPLERHLAKYGVPITVVETLGDVYEHAQREAVAA